MKTEYYIVSGFAKNNGRGAKVISNAKHIKGRLPGFAGKELSPKLSEKCRFPSAGAGDNIPWTVTSVESYHWF